MQSNKNSSNQNNTTTKTKEETTMTKTINNRMTKAELLEVLQQQQEQLNKLQEQQQTNQPKAKAELKLVGFIEFYRNKRKTISAVVLLNSVEYHAHEDQHSNYPNSFYMKDQDNKTVGYINTYPKNLALKMGEERYIAFKIKNTNNVFKIYKEVETVVTTNNEDEAKVIAHQVQTFNKVSEENPTVNGKPFNKLSMIDQLKALIQMDEQQ